MEAMYASFWRAVLIASLRSGQMLRVALVEADKALEEYKKRFPTKT